MGSIPGVVPGGQSKVLTCCTSLLSTRVALTVLLRERERDGLLNQWMFASTVGCSSHPASA
ncbi:hypothetical protein CH29_gp42 [Achromobacter phage JWAlpha]|uniref:Uncharacterized protein n=1 Tax=Achromobacter phage JWAlpha TaxID=1416009 RepID=V9VF75_9CAUD|nr:hypothetical protein CH29_gp42 [Achromobacter phage JWAlpha]AHC93995.1 hypothetical protein JJJB_0042 [Achromobacter phage JWAlpha]